METDKYYTPTLDEFFIGFEYEGYRDEFCPDHNKEWIDLTFGRWTSPNSHKKLLELIENNKVRVKYLDKSDIESLGFIEDKTNSEPNRLNLEFISNECIYGVVLYNITQIIIYKYNKKEEILFQGIIKNKSELIKLLKQLNIN